jgi:hypothetical protein
MLMRSPCHIGIRRMAMRHDLSRCFEDYFHKNVVTILGYTGTLPPPK